MYDFIEFLMRRMPNFKYQLYKLFLLASLENKSPKQKEVYNLAPLIDYPKRYTLYPSSAAIVVAYLLGA